MCGDGSAGSEPDIAAAAAARYLWCGNAISENSKKNIRNSSLKFTGFHGQGYRF
jgi:hypothetical protein